MAHSIPPELLTPEDAAARAEELGARIRHENLMAFVAVTILIELPLFALFAMKAVVGFSSTTLMIGMLVLLGLFFALIIYWDRWRIAPLKRRQRSLEHQAVWED